MSLPTQAARAAAVAKVVQPIMSKNADEARRRVIQLYKAWWREIPITSTNLLTITVTLLISLALGLAYSDIRLSFSLTLNFQSYY